MRTYRIKFEDAAGAINVDAYAETFGGSWRTGADGWGFLTVDDEAAGAVEAELECDEAVTGYEDITDATDREIVLPYNQD